MIATGFAVISRDLLALRDSELRVVIACMTSYASGQKMIADVSETLQYTESYVTKVLAALRDRGIVQYDNIGAITMNSNHVVLPQSPPKPPKPPKQSFPAYAIWQKANAITPCLEKQSLGVIKQMLQEGYTENEILSLYEHLSRNTRNGLKNVNMPLVKNYIAQWRDKKQLTGWLEYVQSSENGTTV